MAALLTLADVKLHCRIDTNDDGRKTVVEAETRNDKLAVQEAWVARALGTPSGMFSRVRQLPLACPDRR